MITTTTFAIYLIDANKQETINLIEGFFEINLNGLKILRSLTILIIKLIEYT